MNVNGNEVLTQELHTPMIKQFKRRKVYLGFKDNIWAAHLAEMESLSFRKQGVKYLCIINVFINVFVANMSLRYIETLSPSEK